MLKEIFKIKYSHQKIVKKHIIKIVKLWKNIILNVKIRIIQITINKEKQFFRKITKSNFTKKMLKNIIN